ncbi:MAG: glycosyltransferase family 2 protein [Thermoanaerobaculia bacterium]|nr:glycosyltransferase family 2 protein [Thermoanaerobaculia bacterium]
MATAPYFVISPNTVLSVLGLLHGPDRAVPTPAEDWREAVVDVVVPALNEEDNIALCLASVARQTMRPRRILVVDDGSSDRTLQRAIAYSEAAGMELIPIHRKKPIGKTPTIKRQARELDSDVEFILDADTVLESENYIERTVQELYQGIGIASACGVVLPLRTRDRKRLLDDPVIRASCPQIPSHTDPSWGQRLDRAITNLYRGVLYLLLQRFVYRGQMVFFGTITNPVGCAVAYRRKYIEDLFALYEPVLGDDLTNSEDIFIGFSMLNEGYRNIQLGDVMARSLEPRARRLPRQLYLWSSAFLQSCYYFDDLVRSPLKALRRARRRRRVRRDGSGADQRKVVEAYRQPFGRDHTRRLGRPVGWVVLMSAIEKVFFPTALLVMILLRAWEPLAVTLAAETAVCLGILAATAKGERLRSVGKGLVVAPIRYASLLFDLVTMGRFVVDLWFRRNRKWRK